MPQISIRNKSSTRVRGWKRVTVNSWPTHQRGSLINGTKLALGRVLGTTNRVLDVLINLAPDELLNIEDLQKDMKPNRWEDEYNEDELSDPVNYFGAPEVNGVPLNLIYNNGLPWVDDGACKMVRFGARVSPMLYAKLYLHWYPGQRWSTGVLSITCSNASLPDLVAPFNADFKMGNSTVILSKPFLDINNDHIGDGQTKAVPVTVVFKGATAEDIDTAKAFSKLQVLGCGLDKLGPLGLVEQGRFNPVLWVQQNLTAVFNNLSGWNNSQIGVIANSGNSGDSEDQCFGWHQEVLYPGGLGAEVVRYLAALGQSRQPCHHLEANGSPITKEGHPNLVLWQSRPHWHRGVSSDQLNKPRALSLTDSHGWWGPDREHLLINTLATAYELTGCPFLQDELATHARNYLMEETLNPGWSTSGADVPRSRGWRGLFVVHMWRCLEDRVLAEQVKTHWLNRLEQVYIPTQIKEGYFWGVMNTRPEYFDATLYPNMVFLYQNAVGAYGEYLACWLFGHKVGILMALEQAEHVVRHAYDFFDKEWEIIGIDSKGVPAMLPYQEGNDAHRTGWYRYKWLPFALWTALQKEANTGARDLYKRILSEYVTDISSSNPIQADWFPPLQQ